MKSASVNRPKPFWAVLLSLVPGLAHLYLRQYKKAAGLLLISAGIILTVVLSKSLVMKLLMALIYLATFGPAALEAYGIAVGKGTSYTNQRWYVILLLLSTGFSALPLLWQNDQFSKPAKIAWTVAVPVLAVLFFTVLGRYWENLDLWLRQLKN